MHVFASQLATDLQALLRYFYIDTQALYVVIFLTKIQYLGQ